MKRIQLYIYALALALALIIAATVGPFIALALLSLCGCALAAPRPRCCAVTLSVPEILKDVLDAFKAETPQLFGRAGFAQDFSSDAAALGDKTTAKIAHVPATGAYDPATGFKGAAQNVTTLIEDVPVTLDQLRVVTVKTPWLIGLAAKGVNLYKAALANAGFALGKYVTDTVLLSATTNVSNAFSMVPALTNFDTFDVALRGQCNAQKMDSGTRWAFVDTILASALGADERIKSKLFVDQRNGDEGFRVWRDVAGFRWIQEYPDFPGGGGVAGDRRLVAVSVRKIKNMQDAARSLGIRKVMEFYPIRDEESGLELTGVGWQEGGTGDVYLSVAILFGTGVGNQGGGPGAMTDYAGCAIRRI